MLEPESSVTLEAESALPAGKLVIVVGYTAGFFGLLPLLLFRLGMRVDEELGWLAPPLSLSLPLGMALTFAGGSLLLCAVWALWRRGGGLPISHLPPLALVSSGPFGALRHPIYVGYSLGFAGLGWLLRSWGTAVVAPALLTLGWIGYAKNVEEPLLHSRFGAAYARYVEGMPRLPMPAALKLLGASFVRASWRWTKPIASWLAGRTVLFRIGSSLWVGYGALLALGAMASAGLALGLLGPRLPLESVAEYVLGLSLAMLLGGRAAWLSYEARALIAEPRATLRRVGFVSFGAYLAMFGFAAAWWHWRAPPVPLGWLIDRTVAACLVCSGFGRLGCLTYGCCYGRTWSDGICYEHPEAKVVRERGARGYEPRVPVQLFSALLAFGGAGLMFGLLAMGSRPGFATAFSSLVYGLVRFQLEGLRDEVRFVSGRLTRGQLFSMGIAGVALLSMAIEPAALTAWSSLAFDGAALRQHWALPLLAAVPVFLVCGYHRGRVGSW